MTKLVIITILFAVQFAFAFYSVGFSTTDITPTKTHLKQKLFLGGYGGFRSRRVTGILDKIYSRALLIEKNSKKVVLVTVDLPGMGSKTYNEIVKRAKKQINVNKSNLFISSTHTHAGPDLQGLWGGASNEYRNFLIDQVVKSIVDTHKKRRFVNAHVSQFSLNNVKNRRDWNINSQQITVIDFIRVVDKTRVGTYINAGAHPSILSAKNTKISRDWMGFATARLETKLDAPVIISNGTMGDLTPIKDNSDLNSAKDYGLNIATEVEKSLTSKEKISENLQLATVDFYEKIDNTVYLLGLHTGLLDYTLGTVFPYKIPLSVSVLKLGNSIEISFISGEATSRLGQQIASDSNAQYNFIAGLTNASYGYLLPSDEFDSGRNDGYEESVSLGPNAGDNTRDRLNEARELLELQD